MPKRGPSNPRRLAVRKRALSIWIVVADASHGRVLQSKGPGKEWMPIRNAVFEQDTVPSTGEIPGKRMRKRLDSDTGLQRHRLAAQIAAFVNRGALEGKFERLVLIAPPKTLGELRKELSAQALGRLVAELVKDLTHEMAGELPEYFGRRIPGSA